MDGRAGILGIGVPSGPINLSSSQETGRTALPSGFKGVEGQAAKGKYRSGYPERLSLCFAGIRHGSNGYLALSFDLLLNQMPGQIN